MARKKTNDSGCAKAVGYCRVSTEEQARGGVSLEAQEAAIRAYATMRGMKLVDIVIDAGVSAAKPLATRDGGAAILEAVARHRVGNVVSTKLDRLFRSAEDCLATTRAWDQADAALHLIDMGGQAIDTSSAMGRFFLGIMSGVAELERGLICERTSSAMRFMRAQGRYTGGNPPYGWELTVAGDLIQVAGEQAVIRSIQQWRGGGLGLRAITRELAAQDLAPRNGGTWHPSQVSNILKSQDRQVEAAE